MISRALSVFLLIICLASFEAAEAKPSSENLTTVRIMTKNGTKTFEVELADTPAKRTLGLMNRKFLGKNKGMLFIFDDDSVHAFWMKNTHIPLDLVFLNKEKKVNGVLKNLEPFSTVPRSIDKPSRYVLEINAGLIERSKIAIGDVVSFKVPSNK